MQIYNVINSSVWTPSLAKHPNTLLYSFSERQHHNFATDFSVDDFGIYIRCTDKEAGSEIEHQRGVLSKQYHPTHTAMRNEWQSDYWCYHDIEASSVIGMSFISHCTKLCDVAMQTTPAAMPADWQFLHLYYLIYNIYSKIIRAEIS